MLGRKSKSARRRERKKNNKANKDDFESEDDLRDSRENMDRLPVDTVVKVYANLTDVDYESPWTVMQSEDVTGSGFVIEGQRILTNAHVVANASFCAVRKSGDARKYKAVVQHISYDMDLAVLTVHDKDFYRNVPVAKFSNSEPFLQDDVYVIGYPQGGDTISITRGIVSRIEAGPYTESLEMLTVQIDAAINSGNSGGPVFKDDRVIGIAFSGLDNADNIGYIIPSTLVKFYLESIRRFGSFKGVCSLGLEIQFMENESLRQRKKMAKEMTGVMVTHVDPLSPCRDKVQVGDVLLKLDQVDIASDGTIKWRKRERLAFEALVQLKYPGESVALTLLRDGQVINFTVQVGYIPPLIIDTYSAPPLYVLYAGLIFVPLSLPFLDSYGDGHWQDAPEELSVLVGNVRREFEEQQLVVLCRVMVDEINFSYEEFEGTIVKHVNGEKVRNLKHLYELLYSKAAKEDTTEIVVGNNSLICIDAKQATSANKRIMRTHKVPKETNIFDKLDHMDDEEESKN